MEIYPEDLGRTYSAQVLGNRAHADGAGDGFLKACAQEDADRRNWEHNFVWVLLASIAASVFLHISLLCILLPVVVIYGAVRRFSGRLAQGTPNDRENTSTQHMAEPLTLAEINALKAHTHDGLSADFLKLVGTVVKIPRFGEHALEKDVREAIWALGTALDGLPAIRPEVAPEKPDDLRSQVERLRERAVIEDDPVIAASLTRRAETAAQRAEIAERTALLLRRHAALRDEVADQIAALRTGLTALSAGGCLAPSDMAQLAAGIQSVTLEAHALTAARAEAEDFLLGSPAAYITAPLDAPSARRPLRLG